MPFKGFECIQCGWCCRFLDAFCTEVGEDDIAMWEAAGRDDILEWVAWYEEDDGSVVNDIWIHPETGEEVKRCPWLRKKRGRDEYYCRIHDVKPRHCRDYPVSRKHARETGCKGIESD